MLAWQKEGEVVELQKSKCYQCQTEECYNIVGLFPEPVIGLLLNVVSVCPDRYGGSGQGDGSCRG